MKLTVCQVLRPWAIRAAFVLVATGLADCVTVWFAQRPLLWSIVIACSLPVSMTVFVIIPMLLEESRRS
jgi:hypothetical protein